MSVAGAVAAQPVPFLPGAPVGRDVALQRLLDTEAIKDLQARYCRGFDRADYDLVRSCYHPDAFDDHGPYRGDVEGLIAWARDRHTTVASTTHFTGNQLVEVHGDVAWAEHYARVYHRGRPVGDEPGRTWVLCLRYVDRVEKRGGTWRIAHRVPVAEYQERGAVPPDSDLGPEWRRGARDRTDPSYDRTGSRARVDPTTTEDAR